MSGHSEGLNAANAQKVMYVIHSLLPQCIREKAGYVSFTREAIPSVPFYFSPKVCGTYSYSLSEKNGWDADWDALDQYFYHGIAKASEKSKKPKLTIRKTGKSKPRLANAARRQQQSI